MASSLIGVGRTHLMANHERLDRSSRRGDAHEGTGKVSAAAARGQSSDGFCWKGFFYASRKRL